MKLKFSRWFLLIQGLDATIAANFWLRCKAKINSNSDRTFGVISKSKDKHEFLRLTVNKLKILLESGT